MYKVMLIDDEAAIRKLLRLTIDWEIYEMEIAGEAASGIEALNIIDEVKPDLCFVDIRMPFMDGIEFSKIAIKRYPALKIIILTAYDEFAYARDCIGIGIWDYQLKPIVKADIVQAIEKVRETLKQELRIEEEIEEPKEETAFETVKGYILENYTAYDLNMAKVAMEFGFNTSYFSRKFKNEMGSSFVDYVSDLRMEKAKKLAELAYPMYQIATKVGIPDPNYFSKCFKKYVGIPYSEYIEKNTCKEKKQGV